MALWMISTAQITFSERMALKIEKSSIKPKDLLQEVAELTQRAWSRKKAMLIFILIFIHSDLIV
jgi:hypothetical protein